MTGMKLMSLGPSIADVLYSFGKELFLLRAHLVAGFATVFATASRVYHNTKKKGVS